MQKIFVLEFLQKPKYISYLFITQTMILLRSVCERNALSICCIFISLVELKLGLDSVCLS